jgi:hypothetical protein
MGVKLNKNHAYHQDENLMYTEYINSIDLLSDAYRVNYTLPAHGYGRADPHRNLSLSKFHRPSRHTFCDESYVDIDMQNAHLQLAEQIWTAVEESGLPALAGYNTDYEYCRKKYSEHYKVPLEAGKQLPIRLQYGGSVEEWRKDWKVDENITDLKSIKMLEDDLSRIKEAIYKQNPVMIASIANANPEKWDSKNSQQKKSSIMAFYFQTVERVVQERCAVLLCELHGMDITRIVPCQDGMMVLKSALLTAGVTSEDICELFERVVGEEMDITVKWSVKEFDERRSDIPSADAPPTHINYADIIKGGTALAKAISPYVYETLKYHNKSWWQCRSDGLWIDLGCDFPHRKVSEVIIDQLDHYAGETRKDTKLDEKKKKKKLEEINKLRIRYSQESTLSSIGNILKCEIRDCRIMEKLDSTPGILAYKNGILDLRTLRFRGGFRGSDYITKTIPHNYAIADPAVLQELRHKFLQICNSNPEHLECYLSMLGYMMTGESKVIQNHWTIKGERAFNGKSTPIDALGIIMPNYVHKLESEDIMRSGKSTRHKSIANWKGVRVLYLNETSRDAVVDSEFLKQIAEGQPLSYKPLYKNQEILQLTAKLLIVSNHPLNHGKYGADKGNARRNKIVQLDSSFLVGLTEDDPDTNTFVADPFFSHNLVTKYKDAFLNLIAEYAKDFYDRGGKELKTEPREWLEETAEDNDAGNEELDWFNKVFIRDAGAKVIGAEQFANWYNGKFYPNPDKQNKKAWKTFLKSINLYKMDWSPKLDFESKRGSLVGFRSRGEYERDDDDEA